MLMVAWTWRYCNGSSVRRATGVLWTTFVLAGFFLSLRQVLFFYGLWQSLAMWPTFQQFQHLNNFPYWAGFTSDLFNRVTGNIWTWRLFWRARGIVNPIQFVLLEFCLSPFLVLGSIAQHRVCGRTGFCWSFLSGVVHGALVSVNILSCPYVRRNVLSIISRFRSWAMPEILGSHHLGQICYKSGSVSITQEVPEHESSKLL